MSKGLVGIYGGTFDPIHLGHLTAAEDIRQQLNFDEMRMVLSAYPPQRQQPMLSADDRYPLLQ